MTPIAPFDWVREPAQPALLLVLSILFVALSVWLSVAGASLTTPEATQGIVSFELAGSRARASAILDSWSASARLDAMWVQGADTLYLLVYPAWLSLALLRAAGRRAGGDGVDPDGPRRQRPRWVTAIAWLVLLAAPFDAIENAALVRQLTHGAASSPAALAAACAGMKFALVVLGAGALLVAAFTRRSSGPQRA